VRETNAFYLAFTLLKNNLSFYKIEELKILIEFEKDCIDKLRALLFKIISNTKS
jgi:hypothetical protein